MQFTLTFSTAMAMTMTMLSALSSASSVTERGYPSVANTWPVSNFTLSCSSTALCEYSFNVFRATDRNATGFNVTCTGNDGDTPWRACSDQERVSSRIVPQTAMSTTGPWLVQVLFMDSTDNEGDFGVQWANATVASDATSFDVNVYKSAWVQ